jgi:hypothetical protein
MYQKVLFFCFLALYAFLFVRFASANTPAFAPNLNDSDTFDPTEMLQWGITGPDELCLYYGSVIGDFFGGGEVSDVFRWKISKEDGTLVVDREGGFQTFSHTFSEIGVYNIELEVRRGVDPVFSGKKSIKINPGADLVIQNSYLLCEAGTATLSLVDPSSPQKDKLKIQWLDPSGKQIGNSNEITVSKEGKYTVNFALLDEFGNETCPFSINTFVYIPKDFKVSINTQNVCEGQAQIRLNAGSGVFGTWYAQLEGSEDKRLIGEGSRIDFLSNSMGGPGSYKIIFEVDNSEKRYCKLSESVSLNVFETGDLAMRLEKPADACDARNGELVLEALTDLTLLRLRRDNAEVARFVNVKKGETFRVTGLAPGLYRASANLGSCGRTRVLVVPLVNPPADMQFQITEVVDETCNENGKVDGKIKVRMADAGFKGSFRLLGSTGSVIRTGQLEGLRDFEITAPAGTYFLEITNPTGCVFPAPNRVIIRTKGQVNFSVPDRFTICSYFDFVPNTSQNLFFRLTYPDKQVVTKSKGESFRLDQEGEYTILGLDENTVDGLCPRELSFFVRLTNPIEYQPELISTDCFGNKQYRVNLFGADPSKVNIRWFNEKNEVVGTEQFLFPTSFGEFKLDVQPKDSEVCPVPPKTFMIERSVLEVAAELKSGVLCPGTQTTLELTTDFDIVKKIVWLYIDQSGRQESLENYLDLREISVSKSGTYEAVMYNEQGCEVGRKFLTLSTSQDLADFEIPESMVICDFFEIEPISSLPIRFEVKEPDGGLLLMDLGQRLRIEKPGTYTLTASSADPDRFLCPVTKEIVVSRFEPFPFDPIVVEQKCDGKITYGADLFGKDPATVDFYWYNEKGELIGRGATLTPESFGIFGLEVRPLGSLACPLPNAKEFEVFEPVTSLDVRLDATPLCPNGDFVTITMTTEALLVGSIVWFFEDFAGNRSELAAFKNQFEIETSKEGTYEARVFNKLGCLVGSDLVMVMRSTDEVRPEVESVYNICVKFGETTEINPGSFQAYQWILGDRVVSEEAVFSPRELGVYTIRVTSWEGCVFEKEFRVVEDCEMKVTHTTGMRLGDSQRTFKVYQNPLVDTLEVWIYNSWGQLVFFGTNVDAKQNVIEWSGIFNGAYVQPGSYAVKIRYKNNVEDDEKSIWSSLTVLE